MGLLETLKQYDYVGIRTLTPDEHYKVGDVCRPSYDWDHENDCSTFDTNAPVKLDGTACTNVGIEDYDLEGWTEEDMIIDLYATIYDYGDGQKVLVAGNEARHGEDDAEIIIKDAIVLHVQGK